MRPVQAFAKYVVRTPQPDVDFRKNHEGLGALAPHFLQMAIQSGLERQWRFVLPPTAMKVQQHQGVAEARRFSRQLSTGAPNTAVTAHMRTEC